MDASPGNCAVHRAITRAEVLPREERSIMLEGSLFGPKERFQKYTGSYTILLVPFQWQRQPYKHVFCAIKGDEPSGDVDVCMRVLIHCLNNEMVDYRICAIPP